MEAERIVHQIMNQHIKHDINRKKSTKVKFCGYDRKTFDLQLQIKRSILRLALYYVLFVPYFNFVNYFNFSFSSLIYVFILNALKYTYIEKS